MKYVKLEHRLFISMDRIAITYVKFDTNDKEFKNIASDLWDKCHNKQESKVAELQNVLDIETQKLVQTKEKLQQLKGFKFLLKNWFSKERKTEINKLKEQYNTYNDNCYKINNKIRNLDNTKHFDRDYYYELIESLNDYNYCLINKTTDNKDVTTEIWHKY